MSLLGNFRLLILQLKNYEKVLSQDFYELKSRTLIETAYSSRRKSKSTLDTYFLINPFLSGSGNGQIC